MAHLLGIDIGTSGTKTALFDLDGEALATAQANYPLHQPQPGWAEQDPQDWWQAVCETTSAVLKKSGTSANQIQGIGLSGQMHGLVLLDKKGDVLRRAILWCDQRTSRECTELSRLIGQDRLKEITGNPALTGFTAVKLLWVKNKEPDLFEKIHTVLLPKDYIRFRLTGETATEASDASGMQLLDLRKRNWSRELLSDLALPADWFGRVCESHEISGRVTGLAARSTGLSPGTPVVGGAGDQSAGAIGNGIIRPEILSTSIGTSGVVLACADRYQTDPLGRVHTLCHAMAESWQIMGVTQGAGLSLRWFRDTFCHHEAERSQNKAIDVYDLMTAQAAMSPAGSEGLLFLPYMMGERTPHLDPWARAVFFGLNARHTRRDMIRSIMEGVIYSLKDALVIMKTMNIPLCQIRSSGGGSKSVLWQQMQADIFETEICRVKSSEGPAHGVALLAGVGTGAYSSLAEACEHTVKTAPPLRPNPAVLPLYRELYDLYTRLYPDLKTHYTRLATIYDCKTQ